MCVLLLVMNLTQYLYLFINYGKKLRFSRTPLKLNKWLQESTTTFNTTYRTTYEDISAFFNYYTSKTILLKQTN